MEATTSTHRLNYGLASYTTMPTFGQYRALVKAYKHNAVKARYTGDLVLMQVQMLNMLTGRIALK